MQCRLHEELPFQLQQRSNDAKCSINGIRGNSGTGRYLTDFPTSRDLTQWHPTELVRLFGRRATGGAALDTESLDGRFWDC